MKLRAKQVVKLLNSMYHQLIHDDKFDHQRFKDLLKMFYEHGYYFELYTPPLDFTKFRLEEPEQNLNQRLLKIRSEISYAQENFPWMDLYIAGLVTLSEQLVREIMMGLMEKGYMRFTYFEFKESNTIRFTPAQHSIDILVYTNPLS